MLSDTVCAVLDIANRGPGDMLRWPGQVDPQRAFLDELVAAAPRLAEQHAPRPYRAARMSPEGNTRHTVVRDIDSAHHD